MKNQIKHIFFDLDDTLWDFEKNSSEILNDLFKEFDLQNKLQITFTQFLTTYKEINTKLWAQYGAKIISKEELRNNRFNIVFNKFSYDNYNENLVISEEYLSRAPHKKNLKEDCVETLSYLSQKYKLHIITNGFKEVQNIKIDTSGIREYFQNIIISEEYQLSKPEPQIFKLAETLSNSTQEQCVLIGDNVESDIVGANNAGWKSIHFHQNMDEQAHLGITKLIELKGVF